MPQGRRDRAQPVHWRPVPGRRHCPNLTAPLRPCRELRDREEEKFNHTFPTQRARHVSTDLKHFAGKPPTLKVQGTLRLDACRDGNIHITKQIVRQGCSTRLPTSASNWCDDCSQRNDVTPRISSASSRKQRHVSY